MLTFIGGCDSKNHSTKAIKSLFTGMQNTLMAHRKDPFERIQQEPFFWPSVFRNMIELDAGWVAGGDDGFLAEWRRIFAPGWKTRLPGPRLITITAGDGNSPETAFVINAPDVETRIAAEYWYLYYTYGRDWELETQWLVGQCDVVKIILSGGVSKTVFFNRRCGPAGNGLVESLTNRG